MNCNTSQIRLAYICWCIAPWSQTAAAAASVDLDVADKSPEAATAECGHRILLRPSPFIVSSCSYVLKLSSYAALCLLNVQLIFYINEEMLVFRWIKTVLQFYPPFTLTNLIARVWMKNFQTLRFVIRIGADGHAVADGNGMTSPDPPAYRPSNADVTRRSGSRFVGTSGIISSCGCVTAIAARHQPQL